MANVIKHKRGSGSDPVASDLVVGEVAIRTDVGKLFTKMDNGTVAEIAGGGSDIAINTLSSSSGTGGGSATFNGSAYRFTLSAPPSVSAQQLLVSINGVIQKPVAGTGQPSEGFSVDGTDIILGDAPATGSDFFILTFKSLGVSEPADNSVTSAKIVDGAIVNADINTSAAIAGSKISPTFTSSLQVTSGNITASDGGVLINGAGGAILYLNDSDDNPDYQLRNIAGAFSIHDGTNSATRLAIDSSGRVGIGTTSPETNLHINTSSASSGPFLRFTNPNGGDGTYLGRISAGDASGTFYAGINIFKHGANDGEIRFRTKASGTNLDVLTIVDKNVGIGTTSPNTKLEVIGSTTNTLNYSDGSVQIVGNSPIAFVSQSNLNPALNRWGFKVYANNVDGNFSIFDYRNSRHALLIDSSGNVGINDTSPRAELSVAAVSGNAPHIDIGQAASNNFKLGYDSGHCILGAAASAGDFIFKNNVNSDGHPGGSGTELMRIDSSGDTEINSENDKGLFVKTDGNNAAVRLRATGGSDSGGFRLNHNAPNSLLLFDRISSNGVFASTLMALDTSGRLGIGTTSPSQLLHIKAGNPVLEIEGTASTTGDTGVFLNANGNHWFLRADNFGSQNVFSIKSGTPASSTHRLLVDSSGRVGIGTSSPSVTLDIEATTPTIRLTDSDASGTPESEISGGGGDLTFSADRDDENSSTVIDFKTDGTQRMRITSSGIFVPAVHNRTTSASVNMRVDSDGEFRRSTSSKRYKKDITTATWGLAEVLKLKPITYKNNSTEGEIDDKTYAGFTAEDMHDLGLTEFVDYNENNQPDALAYGNMVALMAKAIQDLNAKVEALEAK